jgi:antitoxin HicB
MTTHPYIGSSLDALLEEDGILEEVDAIAIKRVLAWQVSQLMQEKGLTKTAMAQKMKTSRASLDRLLDPENTSVTLNTMVNAAKAVGKRLRIELV